MKPFRERNPFTIGAIAMTVLVLLVLAAFNADELPIVGGGTTYRADFSEAAGLKPKDEVRIAGVKVGKVTDVALEGDHVTASFKVDQAWVGDRTTAAIKIKTVLGQKYIALDPQGGEALNPSTPIPRNHTFAPYDVQEAFGGLANTIQQIDTNQLAKSFSVISDTFRDSPSDVRGALDGLSSLSRTIASRDDQLAKLVSNTSQITQTLADRDQQFQRLLSDGNLLLSEVRKRKDAIDQLLRGTRSLSVQLQGLVADNNAQLRPALEQLDRVAVILQRNQDNLGRTLQQMVPFYRLFANALGNGRWFDTYICGFLPPAVGPINQEGCRP